MLCFSELNAGYEMQKRSLPQTFRYARLRSQKERLRYRCD
jgi:hypothetical protein